MLKSEFPLEQTVGIRYFITDSVGLGGRLRGEVGDFKVSEVPIERDVQDEGDYTHFTLEKTNWDTIRAIGALSRALGVSRKRFGFAGTKDKRAITRQRMAVWNVTPDRLGQIKIKDLSLSDFVRSSDRIIVGGLIGNDFEILLRDPEVTDDDVLSSCRDQILERGVPNYFGYQRFGVMRPNTHTVGKLIVKGDVEGAVLSYISDYYEGEREDAWSARKDLKESGDYKKALKDFPKRLSYERTMIEHLHRKPKDFTGAFRRLHKKLRQMFIHGYQSYLFNIILSRLIEDEEDIKGGFIPILGFKSTFSEGHLGEVEKALMDEEGVSLSDFKIQSIPEISSRGAIRATTLNPEISYKILEDESIIFKFFLTKGNYATMVMREFMKANPTKY
jgi:tRNA pseudouridine13 synthase